MFDFISAVPLLIVFLMSFVVEGITEYFGGLPFDNIPSIKPLKWVLPYLAVAFGVAGSFFYNLDLFAIIANVAGSPIESHWFGILLTGLGVARGSNFVHLIFKFLIEVIQTLKAGRGPV